MAMPYDVTTKELVEFNPPDWLDFLGLPSAPVTVVDADLATLSFEADKVLRVDDPNGAYILHLDFQSSYDGNFDLRVLRYNVLLSERHRLPVISIGVLLRSDAQGVGATGRIQWRSPSGMSTLDFSYTLIRVWEIPPEQFLNAGLALLPLAPIAKVAKSRVQGVWNRVKAKLAQIVPQSQEKKLRAATYILMGLKYEKAFVDQVIEGVVEMRESVTFQAILREGLEEGREEGEILGERAVILRLGEKRFGTPTKGTVDALNAITDRAELEALSLRLLEVESWNELLPSS